MTFIGTNSWAAPRLKDAALSAEKLGALYVEVRVSWPWFEFDQFEVISSELALSALLLEVSRSHQVAPTVRF